MPRTFDDPVLGGEPAAFTTRRLQIDVLGIAEKLDRRGAEQNDTPSVNCSREMDKAILGVDVAQTVFYQESRFLDGGQPIQALSHSVYFFLFGYAKLNDINSFTLE
jgi:hypothetical protein